MKNIIQELVKRGWHTVNINGEITAIDPNGCKWNLNREKKGRWMEIEDKGNLFRVFRKHHNPTIWMVK